MESVVKSSESNELELLERVFLRLGVAESDDKLESCLSRFLLPTILKITSPHKPVQDKVLELLTHISKRIKSRPDVPLPLIALLSVFTDTHHPPQVANFTLVYIKLGFPRLPGNEKGRLIPSLIDALEGKTTHQQDSILQLVLPSLPHLVLPDDLEQRRSILQLQDKPVVRATVLEFMRAYLLLPYGAIDVDTLTVQAPPGLSKTLVTRVTGGIYLHPEELEKMKLAILKLLSSEVFSADEMVVHFIIAAGDNRHNVSDRGDHHLRQFSSSVDWDSATLVSQLYSLYQGTVATPAGKKTRPQSSNSVKDRVSPASLRVKLRLLPYITRSSLAASCFPQAVQVVFDGLFSGITNPRLRILSLQLVHHICSRATDQKLTVMAPVLLTGLNKIIDQPDEETSLRALSYTAVGKISKQVPSLFQKDTKQISKLFDAVKKDLPTDVGLAVQECLSSLALAYRGVRGQNALLLEALLLENIYSVVPQCRLMSVKCALAMFPFNHTPSRLVCIVATGDSKEDVREHGKRGLKKVTWEQGDFPEDWSHASPLFSDMVDYLHRRAKVAMETGGGYSTAAGKLPFPPASLSEGVVFLQACLYESSGSRTTEQLDLSGVKTYLHQLYASNMACLSQYVGLLEQSLGPAGDADLHCVAMAALLEVLACSTPDVALSFKSKLQWIKSFTASSRQETREAAAHLLGVLSDHLSTEELSQLAQDLLKDATSEVFSVQLGALSILGHVISHVMSTSHPDEEKMDSSDRQSISKELVHSSLLLLSIMVRESKTSILTLTAVSSLGVIFKSGLLPLPNGPGPSTVGLTKLGLVETLVNKMDTEKDIKVKGRCALSLGYLSVGDPSFPHKRVVLEALFDTREEKAIDLHFTIGEAIACTAAGPLCTAAWDQWEALKNDKNEGVSDMTAVSSEAGDGVTSVMVWAVETLLERYTVKASPIVRQTACVWLLSLVKHTSRHPDFSRFLERFQMTFMNLLSEKNDMTQEIASRGMGLVYEMSPPSEREALVNLLVGTLMEGRRSDVKVSGDTQLFNKGMLGKAPQGGSISTYKELCSLASDLNNPHLVYKFLHLANHHSLWNSKKGAAFGFSSIAAQAQEQLSPHLPLLVPRLYRYKYDPSPNIQLAMSNIWAAVVPESKKAVDVYLREILADLRSNLNNPQWRNRESSCMALSDLLSGRQVGEIVDDLIELWEMCLRVLDDIKESVRKAAATACKALHKLTVRACDGTTMSKTGTQVIQAILPLLLDKGMTNPSDEVKAISLVTILKVSQNAGPLLKPHVAVLIPTLLEALSSLETQALNTITLQYSGETSTQEKLDDLRVAASKSSPLMEIVNLCTQQVDTDVLSSLIPRLVEVLKRGVGLGTKVAAAQVVVSLVHHCLHDLTPYAGKLVNALLSGLSDRSAGVRKAYAGAAGYLVKIAKETTLTKMAGKLKSWYFEKDDDAIQAGIAMVLHSSVTRSLDAVSNHATDFLPLVFLAKHAQPVEEDPTSAAIVKLWEETWLDLVPSTKTGVKLYLSDLLDIACSALQAQLWRVKALGASSIATITESMGPDLHAPHLTTILTTLLSALQGIRIWEGK
ncbi:proteasome adapter and scaffold protein ECM29-like isoform X2 [Halichondria panicea]|uniref:proteasome adapter and scaffold protein ECM29-like isoform X2 n=1 Tax=Halichondria panicea TaxID=6063 RepID=UPI00312B6AAD